MVKRGSLGVCRGNSKAQSSLEFLMIMGVAMMMILPLVAVFFQQSENLNTEITESQADKVASEIRDAADEVFYLGAPSKKTISVYMPDNVVLASIADNRIILTIDAASGDYELVKWCAANFTATSTLDDHPGIHVISVEAYPGGEVMLSDN